MRTAWKLHKKHSCWTFCHSFFIIHECLWRSSFARSVRRRKIEPVTSLWYVKHHWNIKNLTITLYPLYSQFSYHFWLLSIRWRSKFSFFSSQEQIKLYCFFKIQWFVISPWLRKHSIRSLSRCQNLISFCFKKKPVTWQFFWVPANGPVNNYAINNHTEYTEEDWRSHPMTLK